MRMSHNDNEYESNRFLVCYQERRPITKESKTIADDDLVSGRFSGTQTGEFASYDRDGSAISCAAGGTKSRVREWFVFQTKDCRIWVVCYNFCIPLLKIMFFLSGKY